jgi:hypothetical protein
LGGFAQEINMSKEEELKRFRVELVKQIEKGNVENQRYFEINIARLTREVAAQLRVQLTGGDSSPKRAWSQPKENPFIERDSTPPTSN